MRGWRAWRGEDRSRPANYVMAQHDDFLNTAREPCAQQSASHSRCRPPLSLTPRAVAPLELNRGKPQDAAFLVGAPVGALPSLPGKGAGADRGSRFPPPVALDGGQLRVDQVEEVAGLVVVLGGPGVCRSSGLVGVGAVGQEARGLERDTRQRQVGGQPEMIAADPVPTGRTPVGIRRNVHTSKIPLPARPRRVGSGLRSMGGAGLEPATPCV